MEISLSDVIATVVLSAFCLRLVRCGASNLFHGSRRHILGRMMKLSGEDSACFRRGLGIVYPIDLRVFTSRRPI